jgi:ribosome-associated protein
MTMRFRRKSKDEGPKTVVREVPIREESIRLGQFLKLSDLIDSGADAKPLLADGMVLVNGELETRRGRQLVKGDVVSLGDDAVRVS